MAKTKLSFIVNTKNSEPIAESNPWFSFPKDTDNHSRSAERALHVGLCQYHKYSTGHSGINSYGWELLSGIYFKAIVWSKPRGIKAHWVK